MQIHSWWEARNGKINMQNKGQVGGGGSVALGGKATAAAAQSRPIGRFIRAWELVVVVVVVECGPPTCLWMIIRKLFESR